MSPTVTVALTMSDDNFLIGLGRGKRLKLGATSLKNALPPLLSSHDSDDDSSGSSREEDKKTNYKISSTRRRRLKERRSLALRIIHGEEVETSDEAEEEEG